MTNDVSVVSFKHTFTNFNGTDHCPFFHQCEDYTPFTNFNSQLRFRKRFKEQEFPKENIVSDLLSIKWIRNDFLRYFYPKSISDIIILRKCFVKVFTTACVDGLCWNYADLNNYFSTGDPRTGSGIIYSNCTN